MSLPSDDGRAPSNPGASPPDLSAAPSDLKAALGWASARLAEAGVASPAADAQWLAAHAMGVSRGELMAASLRGAPTPEGFERLVERRARREPLQHILGTAGFYGLELEVGPGVFVPRPETETLVEQALKVLQGLAACEPAPENDVPATYDALVTYDAQAASRQVRIADWCAGSGAIAAALASHVTEAKGQAPVHIEAVEASGEAASYASRNLAGTGVELIEEDVFTHYAAKPGCLDMVCVNPPYVPDATPIRDVETQFFDPHTALYGGGGDGLSIPFALIELAGHTLRPGGVILMEHAEEQGSPLRHAACATGAFNRTQTMTDLTGRDRVTIMWRNGAEAAV
ncbi:peptide chain release factor N(5)-glutamine methyltransferase [Pseudoglutamicibacter albus]|uniref:N5-glutamine methyltransferase family protein n=1 Tax=Pseudoglutamicibacter albus TaxID=98671 RepID=UPI001EF3E6A4|nr:HemK/PrmC family methyltransferase [Pseudoglutamicibacter albus]MCG7305226.1 peptide chain release factor N(5)-glutamine methyltransferase [Pseudoglutamicibacter albus]